MSDSTRVIIIKFGELYPFFSLIWFEKLLLSVWISDETLLKVTLFNVASSFGYDTGINESPPPCVWYVTKTLSPMPTSWMLQAGDTFNICWSTSGPARRTIFVEHYVKQSLMTKQASQRDERKTTHFNENRNKRFCFQYVAATFFNN